MTDLVKHQEAAIVEAASKIDTALIEMASVLSVGTLAPETLTKVIQTVKTYEKAIEKLTEVYKARYLNHLKEKGVAGETGTLTARVGAYTWEARVQSNKYDEKRIEALVRAKGMEPEDHMDAHITYKVNEAKLDKAIERGLLKREDVEACRAERRYAVQQPKLAKEDTYE